MALSYLLWAVSYNFLLFLLARVLCGLCKGNISISTSIVTDVTSHQGRNRGMVRGGEGESEGQGMGRGEAGWELVRGRRGDDEGWGSGLQMAIAAESDCVCGDLVLCSSLTPLHHTPCLNLTSLCLPTSLGLGWCLLLSGLHLRPHHWRPLLHPGPLLLR